MAQYLSPCDSSRSRSLHERLCDFHMLRSRSSKRDGQSARHTTCCGDIHQSPVHCSSQPNEPPELTCTDTFPAHRDKFTDRLNNEPAPVAITIGSGQRRA